MCVHASKCFHHLLHDGGQSPQGQPSLIPTCHHSTAQLHHDAPGLLELTPVGQGLPMGPGERDCIQTAKTNTRL